MENYKSASLAYNDGLEKAKNDLAVLIHQDVYLPKGWIGNLIKTNNIIEKEYKRCGVIGCYGVDINGERHGHVYSNGLIKEIGNKAPPKPVKTLDELVLVIHKTLD